MDASAPYTLGCERTPEWLVQQAQSPASSGTPCSRASCGLRRPRRAARLQLVRRGSSLRVRVTAQLRRDEVDTIDTELRGTIYRVGEF